MKRFIIKTISFLFVLFSFLLLVDYPFSEYQQKSGDVFTEAWYDVMHGEVLSDIVVMGSSRAMVMVSPAILDSILNQDTYNLGIEGGPIDRQVMKYNMYRRYNKKPKLIVQNIDAWLLQSNKGYEREQFFPYFWDRSFRRELFRIEKISIAEKFFPCYRYFGYTPSHLFKSQQCSLYKGYSERDATWNGTAYSQVDSCVFRIDNELDIIFNNYLAHVMDDGIKILFVYAPLYVGAQEKISNEKEMRDYYVQCALKYDIPILDYSNMDICSDTTCFYNAMHLNKKGAELYSARLAEDIDDYLKTDSVLEKLK